MNTVISLTPEGTIQEQYPEDALFSRAWEIACINVVYTQSQVGLMIQA